MEMEMEMEIERRRAEGREGIAKAAGRLAYCGVHVTHTNNITTMPYHSIECTSP